MEELKKGFSSVYIGVGVGLGVGVGVDGAAGAVLVRV